MFRKIFKWYVVSIAMLLAILLTAPSIVSFATEESGRASTTKENSRDYLMTDKDNKKVVEMEFQILDGEKVVKSKKLTVPLKENKDGNCFIYENNGLKVIVPSNKVKNKQEYIQNLKKNITAPITPKVTISTSLWDYDSKSVMGDKIENEFDTTVHYGLSWTWADIASGNSYAAWLGTDPWNADKITHTDTWGVSGFGVSVSYPSGVGISGSGNQATWSDSITNDWLIQHYFQNIHFSGLQIVRVWESCTSTFKFGSSFYTINSYDSAWI